MSSNKSFCRQNYHEDCEAGINKLINLELYTCYVYQSMAFYFDRDDIARKGMSKYFKHKSEEERKLAEEFMKFQNQRGGRITHLDIKKPQLDEWGSCLNALKAALSLEKNVNQALLELHTTANQHKDYQLADWIETHFLTEQVEAIKEISNHITNVRRVGPGLGEHLFDKEMLRVTV